MQAFIDVFFSIKLLPTLIIATLLFVSRLPKRKMFWLRFIASTVVCTAVSYALSLPIPGLVYGGIAQTALSFVLSVLYFFELCLMFRLCFRISFFESVCYCICGWSVEHLSYSASIVVAMLFRLDGGVFYRPYSPEYFAIYIITYAVIYIALFIVFWKIGRRRNINIEKRHLIIPSLIMLICFSLFSTSSLMYVKGTEAVILFRLYAIACCIITLCVTFAIFESGHYRSEYETLQLVESKRESQYALTEQTIDIINTKCHDLRKMLSSTFAGGGVDLGSDVEKISEELNIYDAIVNTGNKALDLVLTEKSLYCESKNIKITIMADGAGLEDLDNSDIYSLFGNILDNAVEAVMKLPEEKRVISLSVRRNGEIIAIHSDNYFDAAEPIKYSRDLPVTTKANKRNHGFGLLSIRMIAEKHGGTLKVYTDGDVFYIDVLLNASERA
ncbi:MAG: GHKL domain-containing protein [Clostridia bacterium]|nr:GHKL domain-containing protein [Clostridia bacterium]